MKYLRNFNSHDAYTAAASTLPNESVAYDKEHVHYVSKSEEDEEEPTDTTTIVE